MTTASIKKYKSLLADVVPVAIETEAEYERMLAAAGRLMEIPETKMTAEQGRLLSLLAILIESYEQTHYPIPKAPANEMIEFLLEEQGLKPSSLWPLLGSRSRVSEILSGKRAVSKEQARKLGEFFKIEPAAFIDSWDSEAGRRAKRSA